MTQPSEVVRSARRAKSLTQAALASAVGCTQSAISMFEGGRADALSAEFVQKIAGILGIEAKSLAINQKAVGLSGSAVLKFCPADECPANIPYVVQGRLIFKPAMVEEDVGFAGRCRYCGEPLQACCSNAGCGAAVNEGSFCASCGTAYILSSVGSRGEPQAWADAQRGRIREVRDLSRTERLNKGGPVS